MRVLTAAAMLCLLAACTTPPKRTVAPAVDPTAQLSPLDAARAKNQHWLDPGLLNAFPPAISPDYRPPLRLALLLPQSGNLATAGIAVRDGVLAGYYAETLSKPGIRVYDTQSTAAGASVAYLKAVNEGAQMIIGPIGKEEVAAVAAQVDGIPVLALNNIDKPDNRFLLTFSLSPEREGELIAKRLLSRKLLKAAVFIESGDGNKRSLSAFESTYQKGGGIIVANVPAPKVEKVTVNADAVIKPINPVLPDTVAQATAMVFMMSGQTAKPIRAALMLNGSGDKPVFATSEIAGSVDPAITIPLDGIEFIQMPWLLGQSNDLNLNAAQLAKLPSARGGGSRLNAFGLDAWLITTHLNAWLANPNGTFNGATGSLHLEPNGRIERQLPWMIYRGGVPQAADVR